MVYQDFRKQKRIANEIEDLLIKYPIARDLFNKRQKRYIELWQTYLKKADKEPQPSENPLGDKNPPKMPACLKSNNRGNWLKYLQERNALTRFKKVKKDLPKYLNAKGEYDDKDFGYDSHFWHAINTEPLPPNPSKIREWDRFNKADKLCCYYAVLARLYDLEKPNALYHLCPENLDKTSNKFAYVSERELSDSEYLNALDSMIKFVQADLASNQEAEPKLTENKVPSKVETDSTVTKNIHIDLSQWSKSDSRNLMQDLLDDEFRQGVKIKTRRHGRQQPANLKRVLYNRRLENVRKAIIRVKSQKGTYKLSISREQITFNSPKT